MKLTLLLIALNVAVFFVTFPSINFYISNFGFSPINFLSGKYYTIITSMFLHANLMHLAGNMVSLLLLGWAVEKKTRPWQYLLVYFVAGIAGCLSLFVPIFGYSPETLAVGASAAISGLVGLGILISPGKLVMFPAVLPLPFAIAGAIYLVATISGIFAPGVVAYSAHLFGFLAGAAFGFVWSEERVKNLLIFVAMLILIVLLPTILGFLSTLL